MTTNSQTQFNTTTHSLHMSLELSSSTWKLGFADQLGRPPRVRTIDAGNFEKLKAEISLAKQIFGLAEDAPVVSCYEAGRDGFWIHRCLVSRGIESHIVDPASIEVNRKKRRAKTERLTLATEQIRAMQMEQAAMIRQAAKEIEQSEESEKQASRQAIIAERLCQLGGIGPVTSWTLSTEVFSWRDIANRRQLAALVGLVPTPHASGDEEKEQGISKSGRGELRVLMIEIAWGWLTFQPDSDLSKWYYKRFADEAGQSLQLNRTRSMRSSGGGNRKTPGCEAIHIRWRDWSPAVGSRCCGCEANAALGYQSSN